MKIKITDRTELMFSQAVALSQNGMMKSTIHAQKALYILNMDDTIIIYFEMNQEFPEPVSFFANDYESNEMEIENGQVVFVTNSGGYARRKTCPKPKIDFATAAGIWNKFEPDKSNPLTFDKNIMELLNDDLSHVELHNQGGLKILQKNIYSGARIEIENVAAEDGLFDSFGEEFEPIGMRTADFKALFSFADQLNFYIQKGKNWLYFTDSYNILQGVLGTCLYDEIPYIAEV